MTEIELYQPTTAVLARSEMNALFKLARAMSETSFAPQPFKNKPYECLAAILTGRELGIGPMESLTQIHVIQGRPTLSAQLMRALVYRRGHSIRITESTEEKCVVVGRRSDTGDEHTVTFTMEDAKAAGLVRKGGGWENYRRAMLAARATSALCRELFPDCLAGAAYVPEEMGGETPPEDVAPPAIDAEVVEPVALTDDYVNVPSGADLEPEADTDGARVVSDLIGQATRASIFAGARERGIDPHGAAHEALGRPVESLNALTEADAKKVAAWIRQQPRGVSP